MTSDEFWVHEFGDVPKAKDFAGRSINRNEYGKETKGGWTVDHILPQASNGSNAINNWQITHWETNREKADKIAFTIGGVEYQVKKIKNLYEEDRVAYYPYEKNGKKYGIVIL
jgi:CRISPR/Cas system Type II protein with McrA/HNH and RuvC-like nuclease domain